MKNILKDWEGKIVVHEVDSIDDIDTQEEVNILLIPKKQEYRIRVRKYMTVKSTDTFDFMKKWNNDEPMPCDEMTGCIIDDKYGMVYMELHTDTEKWRGWIIKSGIIEMNEV